MIAIQTFTDYNAANAAARASLTASSKTVVHPTGIGARRVSEAWGRSVVPVRALQDAKPDTPVVVLDGHLLTGDDVQLLSQLTVDVMVMAPANALPPIGPGSLYERMSLGVIFKAARRSAIIPM